VTAGEMSDADVLEAAADALYIHGRLRGTLRDAAGRMCVVGAMDYVRGVGRGLSYECTAKAELDLYVYREGLYRAPLSAEWNDETADDDLVVDTLRRCAKHLRNEGLS
jgi:hypothetical protein